MRRSSAYLLLLLLVGFVGLASWDSCELGNHHCPPACHFGCMDGCGTVTPAEIDSGTILLARIETVLNEVAVPASLAAPRPELTPPRA